MKNMTNYPKMIVKLRVKMNISQEDLAKKLGVSFQSVNRWENGKTLPNYKTLKQIEGLCQKHNLNFEDIRRSIIEQEGERQ